MEAARRVVQRVRRGLQDIGGATGNLGLSLHVHPGLMPCQALLQIADVQLA